MSKKRRKKHSGTKRRAFQNPKPPEPVRRCKYKTAALAVLMAAALGAGAWLIASPMLEKQKMLERQSELLTSISSGDGVIVLDERFAGAEVDFYQGGAEAPAEEAAFLAAETVSGEPAAASLEVTGTGILYIDSIDSVLPVTDGVTVADLKVAVGHVPQTAPIGSEGNAVIAGHRSYTYGDYFNRLDEVAEGDLIRYEDRSGAAFTYKVYETLEVLPGDAAAFEQPEGERVLTLYTCTPIRTATHRLLVRAKLVNQIYIEEESN